MIELQIRNVARELFGIGETGRFVLRGNEKVCLIRPYGEALALETLFLAEDIRSKAEIEEAVAGVEVKDAELDLARQVIASLAGEFEPDELLVSEYRRSLHELLEAKLQGEEIVVAEPAAEPAPVVDLMEALRASIAEAKKNGWNVAAAIVDTGGDLVFFERMDNAQVASTVVSQEKARTAVRFTRPSKAFEDALVGGRQAILSLPGVTPLEGGVPLVVEGKIVGAIGVSGATSPQDGQCALAAAETLGKQPTLPPPPAKPPTPAPAATPPSATAPRSARPRARASTRTPCCARR